jgi:hypothetical protein
MINFSKTVKDLQAIAAKTNVAAQEMSKYMSATAAQAMEGITPTIDNLNQRVAGVASYAYNVTEAQVNAAADYMKEHGPALTENAGKVLSVDEIGRKLASLGAPAIAFAIAPSVAGGMGLTGGAVITTALAMLGGPVGMIGGLITLGLLTAIADTVGKYGIEAVLLATFKARREQGLVTEQLFVEIDGLWISDELKYKLKTQLATPQP